MATARLIHGIGTIAGVDGPLDGDSILVEGEWISGIGSRDDLDPGGEIERWDAGGATVIPGLIDAHSHPVIGNYTPRQQTIGWTGAYLQGGVTTLVSAGETHWPGRVRTAAAAKANTIAAYFSSRDFRPDGIRIIGGALLLEPGLEEADFEEMHGLGIRLLGEIGLGAVKDIDELQRLIGFARARGWIAPLHFGGASVPGSQVVGADIAVALQPDVISHANGGPTARPFAEIERVAEQTDAALEVVQAGNVRALVHIVRLLQERDELDRLQFGTDTPSGTGVVPLGMLRTIAYAVALGGLDPYQALASATALTARRYKLPTGRLEAGAPADFAIVDAPLGGETKTAVDALVAGDTPGVAAVFVDGVPVAVGSRVTPPPIAALHRSA